MPTLQKDKTRDFSGNTSSGDQSTYTERIFRYDRISPPKNHQLSGTDQFHPVLGNVRLERHIWACPTCKRHGDLITTQHTTRNQFMSYVFRDHDLISTSCHSVLIMVEVSLPGPRIPWEIHRNDIYRGDA